MKKIISMLVLPVLMLTGCFDDKGSYDHKAWNEILSIDGVVIPGATTSGVTLNEGTILEINPVITFKEGVNPDDYTYHWVIGGDTISDQKNLYWEVIPSPNIKLNSDKAAFFWLAINNTKSGQIWRIFPEYEHFRVNVRITAATNPNIGIMVYTKSDNTLEWATIKGNNRMNPAEFAELYVDMYQRYNSDRSAIQGPYVGATYDKQGSLAIYTNHAPDYGVFIEGRDGKTVPLGYYNGLIADGTLEGLPSGTVVSKSYYESVIQQIQIDNKLFVSDAEAGSFPYQYVNPNTGTPSFSSVAQAMHSIPASSNGQVNILRKTSGELIYYAYNRVYGIISHALVDGASQPITADKLIGVFKQPEYSSSEYEILFFVVARSGATVNIHTFKLKKLDGGSENVEYVSTKDITAWLGGVTDNTIWFSTIGKTTANYAYVAKGTELYRFSYLALESPVLIKTFPNDITGVYVVNGTYNILQGNEEIYTAITTYNAATHKSSLHFINTMSADAAQYSVLENAIDGKIEIYIPYQN